MSRQNHPIPSGLSSATPKGWTDSRIRMAIGSQPRRGDRCLAETIPSLRDCLPQPRRGGLILDGGVEPNKKPSDLEGNCEAPRRGFEYHPLNGGVEPNKKPSDLEGNCEAPRRGFEYHPLNGGVEPKTKSPL